MTRLLAAWIGIAAAVSRANAQPPPRSSPDDAYRTGRAHVEAGDRAYDAGEYRAAADEYRAAYQLLPLPDLLFNIAQSCRLAGDRRAAIEYYRRYLAVASTGRAADKAREHLVALEKEVEAKPPPPRAPPPAPARPPLATPRVATRDDSPDRPSRWLPPVVTGSGALLAASGVALWISAGRSFSRLESACAPACDPEDWGGARDRERAGVALGLTGGAVAVAGAVLWLMSARLTF